MPSLSAQSQVNVTLFGPHRAGKSVAIETLFVFYVYCLVGASIYSIAMFGSWNLMGFIISPYFLVFPSPTPLFMMIIYFVLTAGLRYFERSLTSYVLIGVTVGAGIAGLTLVINSLSPFSYSHANVGLATLTSWWFPVVSLISPILFVRLFRVFRFSKTQRKS